MSPMTQSTDMGNNQVDALVFDYAGSATNLTTPTMLQPSQVFRISMSKALSQSPRRSAVAHMWLSPEKPWSPTIRIGGAGRCCFGLGSRWGFSRPAISRSRDLQNAGTVPA